MILRWMRLGLTFLAATALVGCGAPVMKPVDIPAGYFASDKVKARRIGVVVSELPKPDTAFPGAGCLLCIGVANANHSSLNSHVKTFTVDDLKPLKADIAALLKKQGLEAILLD
jgi:hypothetical protein